MRLINKIRIVCWAALVLCCGGGGAMYWINSSKEITATEWFLQQATYMRRLYSTHFREIHSFHESIHSTDTDMNTIITLKANLNFVYS